MTSDQSGRLPLLCCLVAFILTFFVTRTFVRFIRYRAEAGHPTRWWHPRNVHVGGVHIHHVAFGVVLVLISGLTLVTLSMDGHEPEFILAATLFGIGAALGARRVRVDPAFVRRVLVEDGRTSVDAVFAAVGVGGTADHGLAPVDVLPADLARRRRGGVAGRGGRRAGADAAVGRGGGAQGQVVDGSARHVHRRAAGHRRDPACRVRMPRGPAGATPPSRTKCGARCSGNGHWRRPVVRAKLWLQCAIAGTPRLPDERTIDAELDREVHPAPPPEGTEPILIGG